MNSFGTSQLKFGLCDAKDVISNRELFQRDAILELEKVTSLYCGKYTKGWILLPLYELQQLNLYATNFELEAGNLLLKNLAIVQAQCVTTGIIDAKESLYLVELTDARSILCNKWFKFPINAQYNMRSPAYPQSYYSGSLNSGIAWTWSTMLSSIWTSMSLLSSFPGLPVIPTGTPENYDFTGVSAWDALCEMLRHLGLMIACDLTSSSPFTIVSDGADDAVFTAKQTLYNNRLEEDLAWLDVGSGRVPKTVVVYFRYRTEQYGQEETVRGDSLQLVSNQLYSISVATAFTLATGIHFLHDDFTIRRDYDGVTNTNDVATAAIIAVERVQQYMDIVYNRTTGNMTQVYAGALPFTTGSQVDSVCWQQTKTGWRTTIARNYAS